MSLKFRLLAAHFEKLTLGTNPSEKTPFLKVHFCDRLTLQALLTITVANPTDSDASRKQLSEQTNPARFSLLVFPLEIAYRERKVVV